MSLLIERRPRRIHASLMRPLVWLLSFLLFLPALGVLAAQLGKDVTDALSVVTSYTTEDTSIIDSMVEKSGLHAGLKPGDWHGLPAIHKVEFAYRAAEKARPGRGGQEFLALLSRQLAQMHEAIIHEPLLSGLKSVQVDPPLPFEAPAPRYPGQVPDAARNAITRIAGYTTGGTESAFQWLTSPYGFGLPADEAYEILASSRSHKEAFISALASRPEHMHRAVLSRLAVDLRTRYEAARYESLLDPFDTNPPDYYTKLDPPPVTPSGSGGPGSGGPGSGGPGGGGGGGPSRSTVPKTPDIPDNGRAYQHFSNTQITRGRGFSKMSRGFSGFGGVVFGNDVSSAMGKIQSLRYAPSDGEKGDLVVTLADGTEVTYGPVDADLVRAAHRIVYTGVGELAPLAAGEGVGLVGIFDNAPSYQCDVSTAKIEPIGSAFHVVLHPALGDSQIGWSTLMVDIMPVKIEGFLAQVARSTPSAANQLDWLFKSMNTEEFGGTWKVVDAPIEFRREHTRVVAWRLAEGGINYPDGLLRTAFLEMRTVVQDEAKVMAELVKVPGVETMSEAELRAKVAAINDDLADYDRRFAERFYRTLPLLTRVSYDYDHLNRFAPVLALVRLAREHGAAFADPPDTVESVPTPQAVVIDADGVRAEAPFKLGERNAASARVIRECREALERVPELGFISGVADEVLREKAASDPRILFYLQLKQVEEQLTGPAEDFWDKIPPAPPPSGCGCATSRDSSELAMLVVFSLLVVRRRR